MIEGSYVYIGVGAALSLLAFFLKRIKEEVDFLKQKVHRMENSQGRNFERIKILEKLCEDRRQAEIKIYEKINGK